MSILQWFARHILTNLKLQSMKLSNIQQSQNLNSSNLSLMSRFCLLNSIKPLSLMCPSFRCHNFVLSYIVWLATTHAQSRLNRLICKDLYFSLLNNYRHSFQNIYSTLFSVGWQTHKIKHSNWQKISLEIWNIPHILQQQLLVVKHTNLIDLWHAPCRLNCSPEKLHLLFLVLRFQRSPSLDMW